MKNLSKKDKIDKLKREKAIVLSFGLCILIVLISLSITYAYEINQLNIYGTAYISGYVLEEGVLPSVPIMEGDNYVGGSTPPMGGTITEEYWEGNTYNLTMASPVNKGSTSTYTYTVKVQNNTSLPWTSGTATSTITKASGGKGGTVIQRFNTTISSTTVNPGEILTVTFTVGYRSTQDPQGAVTSTVTFNFNGEERKLVFNINFTKQ